MGEPQTGLPSCVMMAIPYYTAFEGLPAKVKMTKSEK